MLSLVDYAGSDDESIDETRDENCVHAEIVLNPVRRPTFMNADICKQDNAAFEEYDGVANAEEELSVLTSLPPAVRLADKRVQQEEDLDELVKRKDWELKLAEKAERKRKHHKRHGTDRGSKKHRSSKDLTDNRGSVKKLVVIEAFSGLKGLIGSGKQGESDEQPSHSMVASSSTNLLTCLPEPKNASGISRNSNLFASGRAYRTGGAKMPKAFAPREVSKETKSNEECDETSDEDSDSTDFFGLKAVDDSPMVSDITSVPNISFDRKLGQVEQTDDAIVENNISSFVSHPEITTKCCATSDSTALSGAINDIEAVSMIYSRDVAHLGGTISNAAQAVENMVDVSVDKVLGPDVRATLLKNLHNKSLAEATLSHLTNIPKNKEGISMVARRKHQITYLASVAVAREEQLAEQWSVNRHNKRTSARKYGF